MIFETFAQDVRIGARVLLKEKGFCALAVGVLALGIGAVTTMFSVVNGTLLRGFSFPHADRLTGIEIIDPTTATGNGFDNQIYTLDYEEIAAAQRSFELLAASIAGATVNITIQERAQRFTGAYVTPDYFRVLGVEPVVGRNFTPADNGVGAPKVIVISHQLWQRDFGGRDDAIGQAVRVNGQAATVIGVMPPGFTFPANEQVWIPLYTEYPPAPRADVRSAGNQVGVMGLIRRGVSLDQATVEFTALAQRLAAEYPDTNQRFVGAVIRPLIKSFIPPNIQGLLWTMLAFCAGVLLIACVNVMNMQFARATLRTKELAIRSSLGATRLRLIRQMLTESLLVAILGAAVGIGLAAWGTRYLDASTHNQANPIPAFITFDLDRPVLAFVVAATMLSALGSGLIPAWLASRTRAVETLKESGRGNTSRVVTFITRGLVILQILVTSVLLIGSLLETKSIVRQQRIDYGYDTEAILTARMGLMAGDYPTPVARQRFFDRLLRDLRATPEFARAAYTNRRQMAFSNFGAASIEIEGGTYRTDADRPSTNIESVSEGYFDALGIRLLEGRDFNADDTDLREPVAIVPAAFARKHFGRESALGRHFRTVANNGQTVGPWRTIVGVVGDVRMLPPFNVPNVDDTGFFLPFYATPFGPVSSEPFPHQFATVVVQPRDGVPAATVATALQRAVNRVDPNLPLYFVGTARANLDSFIAQNRIIAGMFTIFGLVAMILASVGLYGVMSFSVNQRTQEFGIRMALGADHPRILRMVLRQGAIQLLVGLTLGLGLTGFFGLAARAAIAGQLFNVSPLDPLTYVVVGVLLIVVGFVATVIPARRATRVSPLTALRAD